MGCNIKEISITEVQLIQISTGYNVSVKFSTRIDSGGEHPKNFFLFWYEGNDCKSYTLNLSGATPIYTQTGYKGNIADSELGTFAPNLEKNCAIRIGYSADRALTEALCCDIIVVTQKYNNVISRYDGRHFYAAWDEFNPAVNTILQFKHDESVYKGVKLKNHIEFELSEHDIPQSEPLEFNLMSRTDVEYDGKICESYGIESGYMKESAFWADSDGINYTKLGNSFAIEGEVFQTTLADAIEHEPFKLSKKDDIYMLDIAEDKTLLTPNNLKGFINELFNANILPYAYYKISDIIARLAPCAYSDGLYYYCRAANGGMYSELLPGFSLKVETAYFNKQSSPEKHDDQGLIKGAVSEYDVSFNGTHLEFNSGFDYIAGSWSSAAVASNNCFGGLIDLFWVGHRSPYFRVIYPSSYFDSTHYPQDDDKNICLCTAEPNIIDAELSTMIYFRGRAAVTLEITVTVNNQPLKVSLGTTVGKLIARYGGGTFTMRRQTGLGYALPVRYANAAHLLNLFLLAGDSISLT